MRVAIAIPPDAVMIVDNVIGSEALPRLLKVRDQAGLKLNSSNSSRGTNNKQGHRTTIYISLSNLLFYLRRNVNNVAVPFCFEANSISDYHDNYR